MSRIMWDGSVCQKRRTRFIVNLFRSRWVKVNWLTMLSKHSVKTYQRKELTRNSSRNAHPLSAQLDEPLWNDFDLMSEITRVSWSPL